MDLNLQDIRRNYTKRKLSKSNLLSNPMDMVSLWVSEAIETKVNEPTALIIATSTIDGHPSIRTVLLKEIEDNRLIFYTNYNSRKGQQIEKNNNVAVTFLWHELERQIHVEGTIEKVSSNQSDIYFDTRPYKSRIGARVSPQSEIIPSREYIMAMFVKESLKYIGKRVPRPEHWGGYAVSPNRIELWQGRDSRLHDRFLYTLNENNNWSLERLAP